jgi:carboxymethylenebutenolidase
MPTVSRMVSFRSGRANLDAYLAHPEGEGPFPGVVVIYEAFGLNDNIKRIADRFADEGYAALAVNLFAGRKRVVCMPGSWVACCSGRSITAAFRISRRL